ncbi:hypothetical protein [Bradyrhizobium japonicum]|uniref:hypothetical protein n=1 Tax=Bradyrhizobium japonicum TaxID=375 RepID=UPI002714BFC7|nr:hypothetical protein [Bradyrhizobium japonicum]WLB54836.1 hypothetical protein QIH94_02260 [Bradyrhizobium japonicum]WLB63289.1 hypothetical protein QIH96_43625 [Bradyrhizobium japonicum]
MWFYNECDAEIERSMEREGGRMADEEAERWRNSADDDDIMLEEEDIRGILWELCDFGALKTAASPDYVATVNGELSRKLKFDLDLRFVGHDGFDIVASISRSAAAKLHAFSQAHDHRHLLGDFDPDELRRSKAEDWSDEFSVLIGTLLEPEAVQMRLLDHLASMTDALCCDRLLNLKEYETRAHRLRRARRDEARRRIDEIERKRALH